MVVDIGGIIIDVCVLFFFGFFCQVLGFVEVVGV